MTALNFHHVIECSFTMKRNVRNRGFSHFRDGFQERFVLISKRLNVNERAGESRVECISPIMRLYSDFLKI